MPFGVENLQVEPVGVFWVESVDLRRDHGPRVALAKVRLEIAFEPEEGQLPHPQVVEPGAAADVHAAAVHEMAADDDEVDVIVRHNGTDGHLAPVFEGPRDGPRQKSLHALAFVVEERHRNQGGVVFQELRADVTAEDVRMVGVDDDRLGVKDDPAAVRFELQTLSFSPMSVVAVDGRVDVGGKFFPFATDPAVRHPVKIAVFVGLEAVMEDLDGPIEGILGRGRFFGGLGRNQSRYAGYWLGGRARAGFGSGNRESGQEEKSRKHKTCKMMASLTIAQDRPACANGSIPSRPGPIATVALAIMPPCDATARTAKTHQNQSGLPVELVGGARRKPLVVITWTSEPHIDSWKHDATRAICLGDKLSGPAVEARIDAGVTTWGKRRAVGRERRNQTVRNVGDRTSAVLASPVGDRPSDCFPRFSSPPAAVG